MLPVKQGRAADCAHEQTASLPGNAGAKRGAFITVRGGEAQFHEFVGVQKFFKFGEQRRGEPAPADEQRGREGLAAGPQKRFLRACNGKRIHLTKKCIEPPCKGKECAASAI